VSAAGVIAVVCPGWETIPFDDPVEAFEPVVRAVTDVVPLVHVERPGTLLMSARGPGRVHGSVEAAVGHLHRLCRAAWGDGEPPAPIGVGVAASRFAATVAGHLSAHSGVPEVVAAAGTRDFLDGLSVRWFALAERVDPDHVGVLERLGLTDLASVRALGARAMIDRFGAEGERMHRLAAGEDPEPLVTVGRPGAVSGSWRREPDDPGDASVARVVAAVRGVCEQMLAELESRARQCTALRITVIDENGVRSDRVWHEPRGLSVRCVLDRLERQMAVSPDRRIGIVTEVNLEAVGVCTVAALQEHLWSSRCSDAERVVRALSMVHAIGDGSRVGVPRRRGARDLTEMFVLEDAARLDLTDSVAAGARVRGGPRWPGALPAPFPATLWPTPRPAEVLDAAGAPVGVTGRHELTASPAVLVLDGSRFTVLVHGGPWPLEERWWDVRRRRRTARVQLLVRDGDDETVHLVHLDDGRWSVVARYD
jgi:protein ImuB